MTSRCSRTCFDKEKTFILVDFELFLSCRSSPGSAEPRLPVEQAEQVRLHSSSVDTDGATDIRQWALFKSGGQFKPWIDNKLNVGTVLRT